MRIWIIPADITIDVEDWQEAEFHHAAGMDAPTGRTLQLDLTTDEARPEFSAWQEEKPRGRGFFLSWPRACVSMEAQKNS